MINKSIYRFVQPFYEGATENPLSWDEIGYILSEAHALGIGDVLTLEKKNVVRVDEDTATLIVENGLVHGVQVRSGEVPSKIIEALSLGSTLVPEGSYTLVDIN